MKKMNNWEDVLTYVHKRGLEGSVQDTIQIRQDKLMAVVRAIERTAGVPEGVKGDAGYPIWIEFEPYMAAGYEYPWLGKFTIFPTGDESRVRILELKDVKR
jgi:hypothetical protein